MSIFASDVIPFSQARAKLSDLADQVKAGAEKIITKNGESYVALIDSDRLDYYHQLERGTDPLCYVDPYMDIESFRIRDESRVKLVELVQETVCSTRSRIRVAGNNYPAEVVRSKLLKLNSEHIRFVMDCLKQNTTRIRNIRQYLLTALFNAPSTMSSYYAALVAHDMAGAA